MRVVLFRAAVSLLTFIIGVAVSGLGFFKSQRVEMRTELVAYGSHCPHRTRAWEFPRSNSNCFPGASIELSQLPSNGRYLPKSIRPFMDRLGQNGPILISSDDVDETYRLLVMPSFGHPTIISIDRTGGKMGLVRQELGLDGKNGAARLHLNTGLTPEEWLKFTNLLDDSCFWSMPVEGAANGFDGTDWILEGVRGGRYHVTHVRNPQSGAFLDACMYLQQISGLNDR
jgi:hypothetical protein